MVESCSIKLDVKLEVFRNPFLDILMSAGAAGLQCDAVEALDRKAYRIFLLIARISGLSMVKYVRISGPKKE